jgi:hypothetical protein
MGDKKQKKKEKKAMKEQQKIEKKAEKAEKKKEKKSLAITTHALRAGAALIGLGVSSYWGGRRSSLTALIPAAVGVPLVAAGAVALVSPSRRAKGLRLAAALSAVGFLGSVRGPIQLLQNMRRGELPRSPLAVSAQTSMALICGKLCLRFIGAASRGDLS